MEDVGTRFLRCRPWWSLPRAVSISSRGRCLVATRVVSLASLVVLLSCPRIGQVGFEEEKGGLSFV